MTTERSYFDNSMISTFKECPRKYYLRHVRGWRGDGISMPLVFGLCWHDAMDELWGTYGREGDKDCLINAAKAFSHRWTAEGLADPTTLDLDSLTALGARTPYIAYEMLGSYLEARRALFDNPTFSLEAVEQPFAVPIYPDRTDIWYIGRLDKVFRVNGSRVVGEHKTTSEYKIDGGFKTSWINSWSPSSQIEGYLYASQLYFPGGARYVWIDGALVHKKVHDAFKLIPISATLSSLDEWLWEVRHWINSIQWETGSLKSGAPCFPRNTDSCMGKYGECSYRRICANVTNPAELTAPPEGYVVDFWKPFDILQISNLGGEFATDPNTTT